MAKQRSAGQRVMEAAGPLIAQLGLELVDVETVREGKVRILRLIIDKPGGVDHDDCSKVSRLVDPLIDNTLNLHGHDFLEVSSPGLERPLKSDRDFLRYQGEWVELTLYKASDGQKRFTGRLAPCTAEMICLEPEQGQAVRQFPREQVAKVKRMIRFES